MNIKERIVRFFAADMIEQEVQKGIEKARMALPITANYDPNNEGYRRLTGGGQQRRDLAAVTQDRMFEIAYFMWDSSAMFKGMAGMDKAFIFAEPITVVSEEEAVQEVIDGVLGGRKKKFLEKFPDKMSWLSMLGEQCWLVEVNPHNGQVTIAYTDPANIKDVYVNRRNVEEVLQVELYGRAGMGGQKMEVIRENWKDPSSDGFGRLQGECFFFAVNNPPNSPRGRSDFLTLFDWIDGLERYGYNYLERAEFLLNFIWDVTLSGMNQDQIREWLQDNPVPDPGAMRAHNEQVKWEAVAPDMKAADMTGGFNMVKSFIMGAARRPDSWFGGGGKAYQIEAEQFGQVPIKDLTERQNMCKDILSEVVQFAIDQAVIHRRLSAEKAKAGFTVNMPEMSAKDFSKLVNGVPQLATALVVAEEQRWMSHETTTRLFAFVTGQLGFEVDAEAELEAAKERINDEGMEDYLKDRDQGPGIRGQDK